MPDRSMPIEKGSLIGGRYRVLAPVGEGGGGAVFLVEDIMKRTTGRGKLALKLQRLSRGREVRSLGFEFKVLTSLWHPNIARVFDFGLVRAASEEGEALCYFTRQYIEGVHLTDALRTADPAYVEIAMVALAGALDYLHSRKVIHGDIKPENIICGRSGDTGVIKLIDFGLARIKGGIQHDGKGPGGSLVYCAPEVILGRSPDERSDLYSLGATFYAAVAGVPPFDGDAAAVVACKMQSRPLSLKEIVHTVSERVCNAVMKLLERDPSKRWATARGLLCYLRGEDYREASMMVMPRAELVGVGAQVERIEKLLAEHGSAPAAKGAVIIGPSGCGKTRLIEDLKWKAQTEGFAVAECAFDGDGRSCQEVYESATAQLEGIAGKKVEYAKQATSTEGRSSNIMDLQEGFLRAKELISNRLLSASGDRTLLIIEDLHRATPEEIEILFYLLRKIEGQQRGPFLLLSVRPATELRDALSAVSFLEQIELSEIPLSEAERLVGSLLDRPAPKLAAAIFKRVGGNPMLIEATVRNLARAGGIPPDELAESVDFEVPKDMAAIVAEKLGRLGEAARAAVEVGAVLGREWGGEDLSAVARFLGKRWEVAGGFNPDVERELEDLSEQGMLRREDGERFSFASQVVRDIVYNLIEPRRREGLHEAIAFALDSSPLKWKRDPVLLAHHLLRGPRPKGTDFASMQAQERRRAELALEAVGILESSYSCGAAEEVVRLALRQVTSEAYVSKLLLRLGRILCLRGKFDEALSTYRALLGGERRGICVERSLVLEEQGRAFEMKGAYREAEASLKEALECTFTPEQTPRLCDALARVKLMMGHYAEARLIAERGLEQLRDHGERWERSGLLRTLSLAACSEGDFARAEELVEQALEVARAVGDLRDVAVTENCKAFVFQRRGDLQAALVHYGESRRLYEESGYVGGLPVVMLNMGTILFQLGRFDEAYQQMRSALRVALRIGKVSTTAAAMVNIANLLLYFGALGEARRSACEALELASKHSMEAFAAKANLVLGEIALAEGEAADAARRAKIALAAFEGLGRRVDAVEARLLVTEALLALGEPAQAAEEAKRAAAESRRLGHRRFEAAALRLEGRCLAALGKEKSEVLAALKGSLDVASGSLDEEWKSHHALWNYYRAHSEVAAAHSHRDAALRILEDQSSRLPAEYADHFWKGHPARRALRDEGIVEDEPLTHGRRLESGSLNDSEKLLRLFEINRKILVEDNPRHLLDLAMDTAVEMFGAERGFLILKDRRGKMRVAAARNIDRETIKGARLKISRSIAEKVARTGEPILTTSAQDDERFLKAKSVHELKLKSVMCAPIRGRSSILGTIYIDNRFQMGLFTAWDLRLLESFAGVIAVALENIRMQEESRRREAELEEARKRLEAMYRRQARKLDLVMRNLNRTQNILKFRYDYSKIVGRSPAMLKVLALIERVIDTTVPVLIEGESGTGKELIARTIHLSGPRREGHFVSINCGALPEALLESELFGYRAGAFTDAREDREGLLAMADGGTIFLDEIGEMSPAMQVKLLRFPQSG